RLTLDPSRVAITFTSARSAFASRPPRPMTLPTSPSATWRCSFVKSPSSSSVTTTASGASTSCFATCSTNSRLPGALDASVMRGSTGGRRDLGLGDAAANEKHPRGRGRARAVLDPMARAVRVDDEVDGLGARVVVTDGLDELAIARRARIGDDDPVRGGLRLADAAQADVNSQVFGDPPNNE